MYKSLFVFFVVVASLFADELWSLTSKGRSAYKKADYEKALDLFSDAIEAHPESHEARFNKALALGALGRAQEADAILSSIHFNTAEKDARVSYTQARLHEGMGDAAMQQENGQPDVKSAKSAYENARNLYAETLDQDPTYADARNNMEILTQKIKNLPEEQEQQDQENDDKDKEDQQDKDKEDQDQQDKDKEEDQKNDDQKNNEEDQQDKEDEKDEANNAESQEDNESLEEAMRLLEHYADDARELNKPPKQKVTPAANGKDW